MKICQSSLAAVFVVVILNKIRTLSIVDKGVLPLLKNSVGLQFYIDIENENRLIPCEVHAAHQKCCLSGPEKDNCSVLQVYPPADELIRPNDRRTLLYICPLINQHDLQGRCEFDLDYLCNKTQDSSQIILPLDTRINKHTKKLLEDYLRNEKTSACETIDQDSLDDCSSVFCDLKYLGHRLHYDNSCKCAEVPVCAGPDKELPDVVYVPDSNSCRDLDMPVAIEDVYAITSGLGVVVQTTPEDDTYFEVKSNISTISQNINLIRDMMYGKLNPCIKDADIDFSGCCKSALTAIILCIAAATALLLSFVCCVHTMLWIYRRWKDGDLKKQWESIRNRVTKKERETHSRTDAEVRNALLKDVIVKDIPMELRDSVINIYDRMERQVGGRRRGRAADVGSQVRLVAGEDSDATASDSD